MSLRPTKDQFSACLTVSAYPFAKQRYITGFGPTSEEAVARCTRLATQEGWTPPQWWQWWRRRDARVPYTIHSC